MNEKEHSRGEQLLRNVFSFAFFKSIIYSFAYYAYEHVEWRRKIHSKENIRVHPTASIRYAQNIYIGKNSHINMNCCVWAGENSKIILGDNLLMGPGVSIQSTNHGTDINSVMMTQEETEKDIVIGNDCWLCSNVTVVSGVHIADGCVIAAGAVVTKDITQPYSVVGGIPAKVISKRKDKTEKHDG